MLVGTADPITKYRAITHISPTAREKAPRRAACRPLIVWERHDGEWVGEHHCDCGVFVA
jgi:hypothetical protein